MPILAHFFNLSWTGRSHSLTSLVMKKRINSLISKHNTPRHQIRITLIDKPRIPTFIRHYLLFGQISVTLDTLIQNPPQLIHSLQDQIRINLHQYSKPVGRQDRVQQLDQRRNTMNRLQELNPLMVVCRSQHGKKDEMNDFYRHRQTWSLSFPSTKDILSIRLIFDRISHIFKALQFVTLSLPSFFNRFVSTRYTSGSQYQSEPHLNTAFGGHLHYR